MLKNLFIVLAAILCFQGKAQDVVKLKHKADNNTLLWEISGNGLAKPSYLFGTFHLLCREDINFSKSLQEALHRSDELDMELKMDDSDILINGMKYMLMNNNTSFRQLVSDSQYKMVSSYFSDSLHLPFFVLENIKPYFLLAMLYPKMFYCTNPTGVEEALLQLNKSEKKPVKGLETIQFQSSIFDTIPYRLQASELIQTLDSLKQSTDEFQRMVLYYKTQQLNKLDEQMTNTPGVMKQYDQILLKDRNKKWTDQLNKSMRARSLFIAVGAGHLPGSGGLINLLKNKGFVVLPLLN